MCIFIVKWKKLAEFQALATCQEHVEQEWSDLVKGKKEDLTVTSKGK